MKLWKILGTFSRCFCPLNWPFFRGGAFSQNWGAGPSILGKGRWPVNYKWFVIERLTFEPNFLIWLKKSRSPASSSTHCSGSQANKDKYKEKTKRQTQRQIQRQIKRHKYRKIPNTQSRKDPNAKSQMFLLRLPAFGGQSCLRDQMISRLPEVRFKV